MAAPAGIASSFEVLRVSAWKFWEPSDQGVEESRKRWPTTPRGPWLSGKVGTE